MTRTKCSIQRTDMTVDKSALLFTCSVDYDSWGHRLICGLRTCSKSLFLVPIIIHFTSKRLIRYFVVLYFLANLNKVNSSLVPPKLSENSVSSGTAIGQGLGLYQQFRQSDEKILFRRLSRHKRTTNNGRCDRSTVQQYLSSCQPCDTNLVEPCENGFTLAVQNGSLTCTFEADGYGKLEGCQFWCEKPVNLISCCPGFYKTGTLCSECPGGYSSPCNNRGTCHPDAGICDCHGNFNGFACEECSNGYYGDSCARRNCRPDANTI
ncbi:protein draper-like [Anneissia japonica]|uniref:protein draper-like n=1 Tax=Anneissia japonica TaxID=1529436 RepID=UPI001425B59C|nr:protein draper-like [Anneissia japonica]